jgi:hypothetical protein
MQFSDPGVDHAFDPLKVVDIKTLASVAESLKKSKDKSKRAIGVFLDRVNRLRTDTKDTGGPGSTKTSSTNSSILRSSGLKDLSE